MHGHRWEFWPVARIPVKLRSGPNAVVAKMPVLHTLTVRGPPREEPEPPRGGWRFARFPRLKPPRESVRLEYEDHDNWPTLSRECGADGSVTFEQLPAGSYRIDEITIKVPAQSEVQLPKREVPSRR